MHAHANTRKRDRLGNSRIALRAGLVTAYLVVLCLSPAVVAADVQVVSRTCSISSAHPYESFADESWEIPEDGIIAMRVQFSRLETEENGDFVILNSSLAETVLTGNHSAGCWSDWVTGKSFTLRLTSNAYNVGYGFNAVAYEVQSTFPWESFLLVLVPVGALIVVISIVLMRRRDAPGKPPQQPQKHEEW